MSRKVATIYQEAIPRPNEDVSRLSVSKEERRRKLDQVLEHAGMIEFDLDPETLERLHPNS